MRAASLLLLLGLPLLVTAQVERPRLEAPPRAAHAPGGAAFAERVKGRPVDERMLAVKRELLAGNLPERLRDLVPVVLEEGAREATVFVTPDYLSIGSDADFIRVPMGFPSAAEVARGLGGILPTRKIVDAVHAQAKLRLQPRPLRPGPEMRTLAYYRRHDRIVNEQMARAGPGRLVSGHKKDVVLSNRLTRVRKRVAIYGWLRGVGDPIQPLSTVHGARYADYSHGVRLVSETVLIDGEPRSIYETLEDPELGGLLSYEGAIPDVRALMGQPGRD